MKATPLTMMAKHLGEITARTPKFTATNLASGCHVFSAPGTDAQGNLPTSNPALVVVKPRQR